MFIGHFALGFAAKRATPRVPLVTLFAAAQFADLLWPLLVLAGIEQVRIAPGDTAFTPLDFVSYPYSHSLAMLAVWGVVFGVVYARAARGTTRELAMLAALVVSHWVLDFVTHRPDMPVYPGGARYGLGLWNSISATVVIESAMFVVGFAVYMRATRARDRAGRWGMPGLGVALFGLYLANVGGGAPPSVTALTVVAIVGAALILVVTWWADRHRAPA
jgi:membrane-bound metal-dependent hydrolase YbcI (DUF457 family)